MSSGSLPAGAASPIAELAKVLEEMNMRESSAKAEASAWRAKYEEAQRELALLRASGDCKSAPARSGISESIARSPAAPTADAPGMLEAGGVAREAPSTSMPPSPMFKSSSIADLNIMVEADEGNTGITSYTYISGEEDLDVGAAAAMTVAAAGARQWKRNDVHHRLNGGGIYGSPAGGAPPNPTTHPGRAPFRLTFSTTSRGGNGTRTPGGMQTPPTSAPETPTRRSSMPEASLLRNELQRAKAEAEGGPRPFGGPEISPAAGTPVGTPLPEGPAPAGGTGPLKRKELTLQAREDCISQNPNIFGFQDHTHHIGY